MNNPISTINLKAPGNWINDPNGFIYYKGKYHLFYQHFPYAPFWGTMHWGHAVSDDLVTWEHLGIALFPTKSYDRNGIFSGSALEVDGKMNLYYTAALYDEERADNIHVSVGYDGIQSQAMIVSPDGFSFDNFNDKKQIIPAITDCEIADPHDCRDPKVWRLGDRYYMCLASTHLKKKGVLVLFQSDDAQNWTYLNRLESDKLGTILECPDLFEVAGEWFLACSPIGNMEGSDCYSNQAVIQPVTFNPQTGEVAINGENRFVDYGFDIYAPQSNRDENGLRVMISWARMEKAMKPDSNAVAGGKAWNGMMTVPRVVELRNGVIYTPPHPNIRRFYESLKETECAEENYANGKAECSGERCITRRFGDRSRIITSISQGQCIDIDGYKIYLENGCLTGDRSALVPKDVNIHRKSATPYVGDKCQLEIYVDPDFIEIFVEDGKYVLSHVTYRNALK